MNKLTKYFIIFIFLILAGSVITIADYVNETKEVCSNIKEYYFDNTTNTTEYNLIKQCWNETNQVWIQPNDWEFIDEQVLFKWYKLAKENIIDLINRMDVVETRGLQAEQDIELNSQNIVLMATEMCQKTNINFTWCP